MLFGLIVQTYVLPVLNWGEEIALNEDKEQYNTFYQCNNSFSCESKWYFYEIKYGTEIFVVLTASAKKQIV